MRWLTFLVWLFVTAFAAMPIHAQDDAPPPQADDGASGTGDETAAPDPGVTFQTFYDALDSQGTWIQTDDYGYVWQPTVNDPDWAPYTLGHWVYTDDGWTWVSDEAFGWATYHYGRWVNLDGTGWCWVPGYTWAPAWVAWRYGNGYAGWAPLPPDSFVGVDYSDDNTTFEAGFHIGGDCDAFYGIGAGWYNFLPVACLGYGNYHGYYCHRGDNYAIINHTVNVTNLNVTRRGATGGRFHHVTTGGPMLAEVNAASATQVQRVKLLRAGQPGGGGTVSGDSLSLYAPRVSSGGTPQPLRVAGSIGKPAINRGSDVMRPLAVNAQVAGAAATEAQVQQARIAENHIPSSAKVMTDEATVRPVLQAPLTSMHPVAREVAQERTVTTPEQRFNPQGAEPGSMPSRAYYPNAANSQGGSATYQPRPTATPGATPPTHTYVRPEAPSAAPSAPVVHQQQAAQPQQSQGGYSPGGGAPGSYHNSQPQSH